MTHWLPHVRSRHAPPSDRCSAFQSLHSTQVFEAAPDAEVGEPRLSILCAGMCEGALSHKLQWSTAAWLSCCLSTQDGVMAFMVGEWQCWFCQFLGLPLRLHACFEHQQSEVPLPSALRCSRGSRQHMLSTPRPPGSGLQPRPDLPRVPLEPDRQKTGRNSVV